MAADTGINAPVRRAAIRPGRATTSSPGPRRTVYHLGSFRMAWFTLPALILLAVLSIWPLITLIRMSLLEVRPDSLLGGWKFVGFANFGPVLGSGEFWYSVLATVWFTLLVLVVNLVVGFFAALGLASPSRDAKFVQTFMIFVWAMPLVVVGNIWKFVFAPQGVANAVLTSVGLPAVGWLANPDLAIWTLGIVAAWASLPFSVVMIRAALLGVSRDVLDAAAVDGAGRWQLRWFILVPMLRPTLLILTIVTLMYGFRSFDYVYVLSKGGPGTSSATLPYLAYRDAFTKFDFSRGATVAIISMIIVLGLGLVYIRAANKDTVAA